MSRRWLATTHGSPSVSKPRYELAITDATTGERLILCAATNPDEATVAFHHQLARLREQSVVGELVVIRQDRDETPILRQPIGRQMAPTRRTAMPASLADNMPLPGDVSGGFAVEAAEGG